MSPLPDLAGWVEATGKDSPSSNLVPCPVVFKVTKAPFVLGDSVTHVVVLRMYHVIPHTAHAITFWTS